MKLRTSDWLAEGVLGKQARAPGISFDRSNLPLVGFVTGISLSVLLWGGFGCAVWLLLGAPSL